ncbi:DUF1704 domain-containing protein [Pseudomonas sp. DY-1]|uniref:flavohemoglobin expression-modulating QEGLA motif protein n=1 Tax=Pseudomonas sp. DY-1 TaxID=1755504 RepID=UPI000EAA18DE|nr:flavohemoglobin expression-modulating QEGLA motif protein [Pseudomonas sp. DY-1]AYF88926.1 DUF1704 domain-containing protein [Pseudomonas sp. DY-1]
MSENRIAELDAALPGLARKIRVLEAIAWPDGIEERFLDDWRAGRPRLPEVALTPRDHSAEIEALETLAGQCDKGHPAGAFLAATARSYACAGHMLGAIGTPAFSDYSARLYQRPDHYYERQKMTPLDAARFFLDTTDALLDSRCIPATDACIPAEDFATWMRTEVDAFFGPDKVRVVVDPDLASKAIAGATRIRLRASARFSELDKAQLLQHEAFVHAGTALNGRAQKRLTSLALGAPRTTLTQEGIAMLAELITGSIDIQRLRRIALRVVAVQQALDGADFIEVFKGFLDAGQTEEESFRSTQRVFRGADVRGGSAFTKDACYVIGMLGVHTLLRVAVRDNRPELLRQLFAGRMSAGDVVRLSPLFESGWLEQPRYVPPWAADLRRLAATLAFSAFVGRIKLDMVSLERFVELEEE